MCPDEPLVLAGSCDPLGCGAVREPRSLWVTGGRSCLPDAVRLLPALRVGASPSPSWHRLPAAPRPAVLPCEGPSLPHSPRQRGGPRLLPRELLRSFCSRPAPLLPPPASGRAAACSSPEQSKSKALPFPGLYLKYFPVHNTRGEAPASPRPGSLAWRLPNPRRRGKGMPRKPSSERLNSGIATRDSRSRHPPPATSPPLPRV